MDRKNSLILKSPNSNLSPVTYFSPGNNPFDDLWKKTVDAISMSEQINRRSSIRLSVDFSNSEKKSLSFCDLNTNDFGRESLGILPLDFERESLGFMNINCLESDLQSGVLHTNALNESLGFRRESLGILNLNNIVRDSLDGRESLGILHLKSPDCKFGDEERRIPDIMLTTVEEDSREPANVLNTGFLQPYSRKLSALSSSSSANPSFNSLSLEGPSRIYSLSSIRNYKDTGNDTGNLTYSVSSALSSIHSPLNRAKIFSPSELNLRSRIQSGPGGFPGQFSPLYENTEFIDASERKFWSANRTTCLKTLERRSFRGVIDFNEADTSSEFHDSVFIEGHILAEKIADGSILNESSVGEVGVLDCTPQPDWPDDLSFNEVKDDCPKCDTETVFKTVDKMLPPPKKDAKLKTSKTDSNSFNENVEKTNTSEGNNSKLSQATEQNVSKLLHNISDIQHEPRKLSASKKGPKEILENLSELLNCSNPSDKQKSEGKNLLNSLADILGESKSSMKNNLDDSGHSSINDQLDSPNKENHEFFEVLDLRVKSTDDLASKDNCCSKSEALDLSLKTKRIDSLVEKRRSQSLCSSTPNIKLLSHTEKNGSASSLDMNKNKTSNSSVGSNDGRGGSNIDVKSQISGKFKKKQSSSSLRKGPMKAVIPVGDMKKKNNTSGTPERTEPMTSNMVYDKRTSTPINEPKLKPMFSSTPTTQPTKDAPRSFKNSRNSGISLAGTKKSDSSNNFTRNRANTSSSITRSSVAGTVPKLRRNSVSEVKKSTEIRDRAHTLSSVSRSSIASTASKLRRNSVSEVKKPIDTLRRRNSVETESIMSSVATSGQNLGSTYQKQNVGVANKPLPETRGKLSENRHLPVPKPSNLDSKSDANKNATPDKPKQNLSAVEFSSKPIRQSKIWTSFQEKAKTELQFERRSSLNVVGKNKGSNVKGSRRNSVANVSGIMSSFAKIRQNMLESPYFLLKPDALNINCVLSENKGLGKAAAVPQSPQLKKTGKENIEI